MTLLYRSFEKLLLAGRNGLPQALDSKQSSPFCSVPKRQPCSSSPRAVNEEARSGTSFLRVANAIDPGVNFALWLSPRWQD